ncbi:MAG: hypothetical protein KatS3mg103_1003 [Phycisphaerales bacterium]|nr:MAG: hypothetical protein KatS3mg103_1003 [Phycisphaerales bacterium]
MVSVRSGAAVSMPGMMDTILNLGLNDEAVEGLAHVTGNRRFAYDAYRRLINMFGDVVMGVDHELFERAFDKIKLKYQAKTDNDVPEHGIVELAEAYKAVYRKAVGDEFPQNPSKQLELAIEAVFKSWNADRAVTYRRLSGITGLTGTAVNIQAMVYGNMGDDSGTGVAFTRNPSTGENKFYGEFLINAQGEDVVAGIRTPLPVDEMPKWNAKVYDQLLKIKNTLEQHYKDMQDIEFTIERGTLFMLQTRTGKRTGQAAVRIACDMVKERLITEQAALLRIPAADLIQLLLPSFDPAAKPKNAVLTRGLPASPGAAVGKPAFTAQEAVERAHAGEAVILVRKETSPEDVDGMHCGRGHPDLHRRDDQPRRGGRPRLGQVLRGRCRGRRSSTPRRAPSPSTAGPSPARTPSPSTARPARSWPAPSPPSSPSSAETLPRSCAGPTSTARLQVRTNADTPEDARRAREFGAQGIGLCRTEHMFFEGERIMAMREMILAETKEAREKALAKLLPYQRDDFIGIFTAMKGLPVTIRLLDPPLHEFLPHDPQTIKDVAKALGVPAKTVEQRVAQLHELNPMLGHRGCRLAITYPEILVMQVRAIVEAMINCQHNKIKAMPEIMIPLVGVDKELHKLRTLVEQTIHDVRAENDIKSALNIKIGTMIEVPRAAITADKIARHADFFSFGTNDLTQMTFGYSRDDSASFLPEYVAQEILPADPFQQLDTEGVGELVRMAIEKGRQANDQLKIGVCGEHGGDPSSVHFCHAVGLDYVSCSPFRVPIARLAAAQAALMHAN